MKQIRQRLTYANVMATIAVFIALGGASYAAIRLPKNSVGPKQIRKNAITTAKIKDGAVTGAKVQTASLGKVPSAVMADNADSLQGSPASAFMHGGGQFFSVRRELHLGDAEVPLFTLPGIGPVTAECTMGTTYPRGSFRITNQSGSTMEQTLQYPGGVDGGAVPTGKSIGFGGNEYVDSVTVQVATRSSSPIVATLNLSSLKTDDSGGCDVMGQATVAG